MEWRFLSPKGMAFDFLVNMGNPEIYFVCAFFSLIFVIFLPFFKENPIHIRNILWGLRMMHHLKYVCSICFGKWRRYVNTGLNTVFLNLIINPCYELSYSANIYWAPTMCQALYLVPGTSEQNKIFVFVELIFY